MLIRTEKGKFIDVVEKIKNIKVVMDAYPVLGRYDAVVHISAPDIKELGMTVMKVSNMAGIVFSETLIEVEQ